MNHLRALLFGLCALVSVLVLGACAAPQAPSTPPAGVPAGAPPALSVGAGNPLAPDTGCNVDADCAIKNVGNCCGVYPACVHRDAAVDPQAVAADCAARGLASVCGFREIEACRCVSNRCEAAPMRVHTR
ncbi:hypothetical protein MNO14_03595 [Luteimonas sp. S4-F44]|uniref:hypothetical protein n=1 Tax=Luteimonas sp. S4-F44 TaxID=2925842 RepID=UPI001F52E5C2|nr:hypothetical protein [Luteimonas sp. S4-F44]UNK43191.1 hypothetical protein MNO14_03595 [Luteimonas sp. S4-F44]